MNTCLSHVNKVDFQMLDSLIQMGQTNPMLSGLIGVYIGGVLTWTLRNVPASLYHLVMSRVIIRFSLLDHGSEWGRDYLQYRNFQIWAASQPGIVFSRHFTNAVNQTADDVDNIGPYTGLHIFRFKGKIFWYRIYTLDSSGSEKQKMGLTISTLGKDINLLKNLYKEFNRLHLTPKDPGCYTLTDEMEWEFVSKPSLRTFDNVYLNKGKKDELLDRIDFFVNNKEFYVQRGLPYKLSIMMSGPPGTGKTSLVKALANYTGRPTYILPIASLSANGLIKALATATGGIVLIEDIDGTDVVNKRPTNEDTNGTIGAKLESLIKPNLSAVLNAFDGVIEVNDLIIISTTNHLDKLDPAYLRPGRTDLLLEIPLLQHSDIVDASKRLYDNFDVSLLNETLLPISGANLMDAYTTTYPEQIEFVKELSTRTRR